jgi:hypothetical protein
MPKQKKHDEKLRLAKLNNPLGPRDLNNKNYKAWQEFSKRKHVSQAGRVAMQDLFNEFKASAYFKEQKYRRITHKNLKLPASSLRPSSRRVVHALTRANVAAIIDAVRNRQFHSLRDHFGRRTAFITNDEIREIVAVCREEMKETARNTTHWRNYDSFLQYLRPYLLRRSKDAWIKISHDDYFRWPSTDIFEVMRRHPIRPIDWTEIGPLRILGYGVGMRSRATYIARRKHLASIFESSIEHHFPSLTEEWGAPASAKRLQKMANSIAAFSRNAKRNRSLDYSVAIDDWEYDLDFLYREYYIGYFNFGWPSV